MAGVRAAHAAIDAFPYTHAALLRRLAALVPLRTSQTAAPAAESSDPKEGDGGEVSGDDSDGSGMAASDGGSEGTGALRLEEPPAEEQAPKSDAVIASKVRTVACMLLQPSWPKFFW